MSETLAMVLVGGLALGGAAVVLVALRPRPRELRLPREDAIDREAAPAGENLIDLTAREVGRDRPPG